MRFLLSVLVASLLASAQAHAIVGGSPASEEYPWMGALMTGDKQLCGGSLVRADWVLTAAHCPHGEDLSTLTMVFGRHKLSAGGGEEIPVDRVVIDAKYDPDSIANGHDLALLHLARPVERPTMRVVSLAETALWAPGRPARAIGWGALAFPLGDVHRSDDLLEVDMPMVSDADCAEYNDVGGKSFDPEQMVCAGEKTGLKGICQGDSGGPLLVKDAAGAWTQVGVSSWGTGCGYPLFYSAFVRLGAPMPNDWIAAHLPAPAAPEATPPVAAAPPAPAAPAPPAVELSASRTLKSLRRLRVSSTGPVTGVKVELLRRGRTVATGALRALDGTGTVRLRARRALRPGAYLLRLRATDAGGRAVLRTLRVRLTR